MTRKLMIALAAVAALGAVSMTSAAARMGGGFGGGFGHGGIGGGFGHIGGFGAGGFGHVGGFGAAGFARPGFGHMGFARVGFGRPGFGTHFGFRRARFARPFFRRGRFFFAGAPFIYAFDAGCYEPVWTAWGWRWISVCY